MYSRVYSTQFTISKSRATRVISLCVEFQSSSDRCTLDPEGLLKYDSIYKALTRGTHQLAYNIAYDNHTIWRLILRYSNSITTCLKEQLSTKTWIVGTSVTVMILGVIFSVSFTLQMLLFGAKYCCNRHCWDRKVFFTVKSCIMFGVKYCCKRRCWD